MLIRVFFVALLILALLLISEFWWRKRQLHDEFSRKFIHITVGSFVAFWPYFLSPNYIKLLSLAFVVAVVLSKYFNIFKAIHSVQRPTWGEFLFAVVVGLLAFVVHHPHIYTAALLEMSLADGLAALVGTKYGNSNRYSVFSYPKSIVGTATFFTASIIILLLYADLTPGFHAYLLVVPIAIGATIIENFAVHGFDNLAVPLFVATVLFFGT